MTLDKMFAALTLASLALLGPRPAGVDVVPLEVKGRSNGTPWVAAAGDFVAVAWGATAAGKTDVFVSVSRDSGGTFSTPVQVNTVAGEARLGGELPPRVAVTPRARARVPDVTVLWTARGEVTQIKTSRSRDGGKTFESPVVLQSPGAAGDRGWPALTIDGSGAAHAIWLDHRGLAARRAAGGSGHKPGVPHDGVAMAQGSALYYGAAGAEGAAERELTNSVCYCCKTALAAAPNGTLYAAWRHVYPGNLRDMAVAVSRNGGLSFSAPVRASEDGWAINGCPDDGPALAVDGRGTVHMVWPTVIGSATPQGAIFYTSTRDGATFAPRARVPTLGGPKPSHPQIAIDRRGRIAIAWDETVEGRRIASVRELKLQPGRAPTFGKAVTMAPAGPAIYPVLAATRAGLIAVWTTGGEQSRVEARAITLP